MKKKIITETFKLQCEDIEYVVNESKGIVTAIAHFHIPSYKFSEDDLRTVGIAKLDSKDTFDAKIGKRIARAKAEKEAYYQFKELVMEYRDRINNEYLKAQNTISKMNCCIQHQKEYIKSF